jgi:hypothetical protein
MKTGSEGFAFRISSDTNPQRREYWSSRYQANLLFFANASIRLLQAGYTGTKAFQGATQGLWKEAAFIPKPLSEF